jgi:hypothetical protein
VTPAEYKTTAESQRDFARKIATKLENGDPVDTFAGGFAAAILRHWADNLPAQQPRKRGQAPAFDHGNATLQYLLAKRGGRTGITIAFLAEQYQVSEKAMGNAIKAASPAINRYLDSMGFVPERNLNEE